MKLKKYYKENKFNISIILGIVAIICLIFIDVFGVSTGEILTPEVMNQDIKEIYANNQELTKYDVCIIDTPTVHNLVVVGGDVDSISEYMGYYIQRDYLRIEKKVVTDKYIIYCYNYMNVTVVQ